MTFTNKLVKARSQVGCGSKNATELRNNANYKTWNYLCKIYKQLRKNFYKCDRKNIKLELQRWKR